MVNKWRQHPASSADTEEIDNERILLERIIHNTEGLDPLAQGMNKEAQHMKDQSVFTGIDGTTTTSEQQANIIESRWEVRARIVAKGYTEPVIASLPVHHCFAH